VLDDHPPDDAAHASAPVTLRRLTLSYFRNYAGVRLDFDARSVVLVGANGAGKTNILEAISLLAPGRGLRRAAAPEIANTRGPGTWAVAARSKSAPASKARRATARRAGAWCASTGWRGARPRRSESTSPCSG
jgi:DNA replication and repair protein RecF